MSMNISLSNDHFLLDGHGLSIEVLIPTES